MAELGAIMNVWVVMLIILALCPLACSFVPTDEVLALEDLFRSTGGYDFLWAWKKNEYQYGSVWNFTRNATGAFVRNPCSDGAGNNTWQGIDCSSSPVMCSSQNLSCSITTVNLFNYNLTGSLPASLSSLSQLHELVFWNNYLSGDLPPTLSLLTQLRVLDLYGNLMTGSIAPVWHLHELTELYLSYNYFSGKLQPALADLSLLEKLYLNDNLLTGPLHSALGQLTRVKFLDLNHNDFSGTLIPELGQLSSVQRLYLNDNWLSGPLATSLGRLTQLQRLDLFNCLFSGPLVPELSRLTLMSKLYLNGNFLTGTIPPTLGEMLILENLDLYSNRLTGVVPVELSHLTLLERIRFDKNQLCGSLPAFLGRLTGLTQLSLASNHFTGPLIALTPLVSLKRLLLQNNQLTGEVAEGIFSWNSSLEVLDLSHNRLGGSVPAFVFRLPRLITVALSLNCFRGELPLEMCGARGLMVLAMDGLGAARRCRDDRAIPFSGVVLGSTLDGRVPSCLWSLPHLVLLHLSGNGLTGSIGSSFPINSSLTDLALAHNKISGTIPLSLAAVPFDYLDLSFNRITGRYRQMDVSGSVVVLEVNRLSGPLPHAAAFSLVTELKILRENLFGCEHVPSSDEYSRDFSCASRYLDASLYVFAGAAGPPLVCLLLLFLAKNIGCAKKLSYFKNVFIVWDHQFSRLSIGNICSSRSSELTKIYRLQLKCRLIAVKFVLILTVIVVVSLPIYCLKIWEYGDDDAQYSTHSYTYAWVLSVAYVSGNVPASLLLFAWMSVFAVCYFLFSQPSADASSSLSPGFSEGGEGSSRADSCSGGCQGAGHGGSAEAGEVVEESGAKDSGGAKHACLRALTFLVNVAVVAAVNILYVLSTSRPMSPVEHMLVQIAVASFKFVYNVAILHTLTTRLTQSEQSNIRMQLVFSIFNKIVIPCLVTAFTSPSCFQNLIVEPDPIQSEYSYDFCSVVSVLPGGAQGDCLQYSAQEVDIIPMTPPFIYNHLCTSVLLTTYIPVYIFMFSFQMLVPVVAMLALASADYSRLGQWSRGAHGVLWPSHWSTCADKSVVSLSAMSAGADERSEGSPHSSCRAATRDSLVKAVPFQLSVMNHLLILLTFGVCSPYLGIVIVASLVTETTSVMLLLGRFVEIRLGTCPPSDAEADHALVVLSEVQLPVRKVFECCLWPLLTSSALFFAFICWDMSGDAADSDWRRGSWAPAVSVCAVLAARAGLYCEGCKKCLGKFSTRESDDEVAMIAMNSVSSSALV